MKSYNWWNLKGSRSIIAKETRHDFEFELQEVKLQNSLQLKLLWRIEELQKNEIFKVFKVIDNLHPIIRRSWEKRKILINFLYNFFSFSATFCANRIEKSSEQRHTQKNTAWRDTFLCFSDSLTKQEAWIGFLWFHFFFLMRSNTPKATISEILQNCNNINISFSYFINIRTTLKTSSIELLLACCWCVIIFQLKIYSFLPTKPSFAWCLRNKIRNVKKNIL